MTSSDDNLYLEIYHAFIGGEALSSIAIRYPGMTRNSVAGIVFRIRRKIRAGMIPGEAPVERVVRQYRPRRALQKKAAAGKMPAVEIPKVDPACLRTFLDVLLLDTCRWINGDPAKNPIFCPNARLSGGSWCRTHRARVGAEKKSGGL